MSKKLFEVHEIVADVETTYAAISGVGWAPAKAAALGDGSETVRRDVAPDGGVELVVGRSLPDGIPGFLQKFLPKDGRVTQTESWGEVVGGARSGTWSADIPGAPAKIGGSMRLEPTADGTRYTIEGEVSVRIPLIGGKTESFIAGMIGKLSAKEAEVLRGMVV